MKFLVGLLVSLFAFPEQMSVPTPSGALASTPACSLTVGRRWTAWDSSNICTGGCSNGNAITQETDLVGGDNKNLTATAGTITYAANQLNGLAAAHFTGGVAYFLGSSTLVQTSGDISLYAIVKPADAAHDYDIFGYNSTNGAGYQYGITATNSFQELTKQFTSVIGTGNVAVSTTAYTAILVTYNPTSGALNFYTCASGSCTSAGSATNVQTVTGPTNTVGWSNGDTAFTGYMVEEGAFGGIMSTSAYATYVNCQYGL